MDAAEFKPPYMSFQTFWSFIDELASKPLPPRIDRSLMNSRSGTDQANLSMALASFGLTGEDGTVQSNLIDLVQTPTDERKAKFGRLVGQYYSAALDLSEQNGTEADLRRAFTESWPSIASSDTRRKAITFFLHAARAADIPLSPHFPTTRAGSGAPGVPHPLRVSKRRTPTTPVQTPPAENRALASVGGHFQRVELRSGGEVTLSYDVSLFDLDTYDQNFVLELIGAVKNYRSAESALSRDVGDRPDPVEEA
ncbi:hypothetical protein [Rathayibacter tritici]|uniref:hypothetical protein n=1 Tax=Rathayibacter tritici TaxID=33888 RepID=UPI0011B06AEE|nr:hypothetical protein [Rathayibacter tritici]